jgi:8-oxo-dGTP pyrophosphatase MutT (NUDIX family)
LLFGGRENEPALLLIKRSDEVRHHRNEWAFPGGVCEPGDESLRHTALRETIEELGVDPADIRHWGALDPVNTRTGFVVWPFVGRLMSQKSMSLSKREVAEVVNVPVAELARPESARTISIVEGDSIRTMPAYAYNGRIIWGATGRIIGQTLQAVGMASA